MQNRSERYPLFGKAKIKLPEDITIVDAEIANVSLTGVGLYSPEPIANDREVKIEISFFDITGGILTTAMEGKTVWHSKLGNSYLMGIRFNEEITGINQPSLFKRIVIPQLRDTE